MKKILLYPSIMALFVMIANSQSLPSNIKNYLDGHYSAASSGAWQKAPGTCESKRWFLPGDFDGDGKSDYVVRFTTRKRSGSTRLHLVAFMNRGGSYKLVTIADLGYAKELRRSSISVIKRGQMVPVGHDEEGNGVPTKLRADAVSQFICESDGVATYIYKKGRFENIFEM